MKKLMIALAVAVSAVALNAASIDWQFSETAKNNASPYDLSSMTAYLFTAADWEAATTVTAKTFDDAKNSATLSKSTGGSGANAWTKWSVSTQTWTDDTAASGNYYVVLFDGNQYAASSALPATAYASSQESHTAASWAIAVNKTPLKSSDFTSVNVPEPTSGLLLLLGMAGLALKRKRA